jgi:DNA polymerase III subunit beta
MKIEVLQENFHAALQHLSKAVPSKPQLPSLACVLMQATKEGVTVAATDLYLGIKTVVASTVLTEGQTAIPAKTLFEVVSSLPAGQMTLEVTSNTCVITSKAGQTKLSCVASEEFPAFPELPTELHSLDLAILSDMSKSISFASSADQSRPVLTSVLMKSQGEALQVVATDGFRLALKNYPVTFALAESLLLPVKALQEMVRIGTQQKTETIGFAVSEELKQLFVVVNETQLFVRLIEGEYPPFEKIVPTNFTLEVTFDAEEFAAQIKRALIFARDSSNIVKFTIDEKGMTCTASASASGEYSGQLDVTHVQGTAGTIAFNGRYLLDFLAALKPSKLWFGMTESLKPALFKIDGVEEFMYVVMPFRVNE